MATAAELTAHLADLAAPIQHLKQANGQLVPDEHQAAHAAVAAKLRTLGVTQNQHRIAEITAGRADPGLVPEMPTAV